MAIFNSYVKLPEGRYSQAKSHRLVVSPGWLNFIVASGDCYSWIYVYPKNRSFLSVMFCKAIVNHPQFCSKWVV